MLDGHAELILTLEEADELGDEAAAWCRARGLAWTEFDDGVRVGAKKSAVRR